MTATEAKEQGFTHYAKMYGFEGFACPDDDEHETFRAKYWLTNQIVEIMIYIEATIGVNEGFPILLQGKL